MTHHWGYVGALTAAVLFGFSATLNKIVLREVHPLLVSGLIYSIAGIVLLLIRCSPLNRKILSLLETPTQTEPTISRRDYQILALVILCGSIIAPFLFINGLNETTAVSTSLLLNTETLFTVLMALIFLKERGTRKEYIGIVLIIIGAIFVTISSDFQKVDLTKGFFGNLMVIGACLFWGIDNNLSKFLSRKKDLILVTAFKCLVGGTLLLLLSMLIGVKFYVPLLAMPYLFIVGAFSIGFSILLFLFALREIGAMKTGVIFSTSSLMGALFAFVVLNEAFTEIQIVAGIGMLCGVYLLYMGH